VEELEVELIRAEGAPSHVEFVYYAMDTSQYDLELAGGSGPTDVVQAIRG